MVAMVSTQQIFFHSGTLLETLVPMVLEFPLWLFALEDVQKTVEGQVDFGLDEQVVDCP